VDSPDLRWGSVAECYDERGNESPWKVRKYFRLAERPLAFHKRLFSVGLVETNSLTLLNWMSPLDE
jgi:hypothetical protein